MTTPTQSITNTPAPSNRPLSRQEAVEVQHYGQKNPPRIVARMYNTSGRRVRDLAKGRANPNDFPKQHIAPLHQNAAMETRSRPNRSNSTPQTGHWSPDCFAPPRRQPRLFLSYVSFNTAFFERIILASLGVKIER